MLHIIYYFGCGFLHLCQLFIHISVIIFAFAARRNYTGGQVVIFSDVDIANGFGNSYTFETTGKCICDKSGLYLLAVYLSTNAVNASLNIYKNNIFFWSSIWIQRTLL